MSVDDYAQGLEADAICALRQAGAIRFCRFHDETPIRVGDEVAERRAYAFATASLKRSGDMEIREDLMDAIQSVLDLAAEDGCPVCGG